MLNDLFVLSTSTFIVLKIRLRKQTNCTCPRTLNTPVYLFYPPTLSQATKTQLRMATKWFILLFAVFAFAASLPSSSSSSKETPSSSSSLNNSSKATCCSTSSPVTFETTGKAVQICRQAAKIRLSNCFGCYLIALVNA